jgi:uncharacterized protein YecT (DUF1311 family)
MLKTILVVAVMATFPSQRRDQTAPQPNCGALPQQPMNRCFAAEASRVSALVEALLREIRPRLEETERTALEKAQVTWVQYRDAHCDWSASLFEGGSIQPTIHATCVIDLTWERIDKLKLMLCEGQGLNGACAASLRYDRPPQ